MDEPSRVLTRVTISPPFPLGRRRRPTSFLRRLLISNCARFFPFKTAARHASIFSTAPLFTEPNHPTTFSVVLLNFEFTAPYLFVCKFSFMFDMRHNRPRRWEGGRETASEVDGLGARCTDNLSFDAFGSELLKDQ